MGKKEEIAATVIPAEDAHKPHIHNHNLKEPEVTKLPCEIYDGKIHEGQIVDVLKKKYEVASKGVNHWACEERPQSSEYYRGQKELLEELSQPPEGWCATCFGRGFVRVMETGGGDCSYPIDHPGTEDFPIKPCRDCSSENLQKENNDTTN